MNKNTVLGALGSMFVIGLIALLYWLTLEDTADDPCANPQMDVSGAVLAEGEDQDALVNRAIILKGACKEANEEKQK